MAALSADSIQESTRKAVADAEAQAEAEVATQANVVAAA